MPPRNRNNTPSILSHPEGSIVTSTTRTMCDRCEEVTESTYTVENSEGETHEWCRACWDEASFTCNHCETAFDNDVDSREGIGDDTLCESCYEEYYTPCYACGDIIHNEEAYTGYIREDSEESKTICNYCRDDEFFEDVISRKNYFIENVSPLQLAGGVFTTQSSLLRARDNQEIAISPDGSVIYLPLRWSWTTLEDGTPISREQAIHMGRAVPNIPIQYRNSQAHYDTRPTSNRPSIAQRKEIIKQKIISEMTNRPSPGASPVHDKIYIGIELELQAGKYLLDTPHKLLSKELPNIKLIRDGSIKGEGFEFIPKIIKHARDWKQIEEMLKTLKEFDWKEHVSCGLHFHLSHGKLNPDNPEIIRNIFRMFYYLEPIIFRCLPIERRNNKYCLPISTYFKEEEMNQNLKLDYWYYSNFWKKRVQRQDGNSRQQHYRFDSSGQPLDEISFGNGAYKKGNLTIDKNEHYYVGRYIGCNLHALFSKGTIELRYFPTTLDYNYLRNWAEIISRMIMRSINGIPIEPIIVLSKTRGNFEKAIKELGKIMNFPENLTEFLKLEYRKHINWKGEKQILKTSDNQITFQSAISDIPLDYSHIPRDYQFNPERIRPPIITGTIYEN